MGTSDNNDDSQKTANEEQVGGIKGTGVFSVADGRDPSTKARLEKEEEANFDEEEITGVCSHCGRAFNVGRPETKCVECGMVMHQFCFDGHVIKHHKPAAVGARIVIRDGKYFAKVKKG